jgi:CDP-diacylglycerol--glycerol-3-phosphate 3-phosphatidyltransferase
VNWDRYAAAWAGLHGGFDPRRATPVVRGWLRLSYTIGRGLGALGVSPTAVTGAGLALSVAVPLVAARGPGWPIAAAVLVLLGAVADSADGAVAVVTRRTTRLGYVYDSLADRIGELCWAAAFWAVGAPWPLLVGCAAMSWLHEYARARATAAGMTEIGAVTAGERPTRVSVALTGLLLAGAAGLVAPEFAAGTATVVAAVWALLSAFGLAQLLRAIRVALR